FSMRRPPPRSTPFPYTTLFRSEAAAPQRRVQLEGERVAGFKPKAFANARARTGRGLHDHVLRGIVDGRPHLIGGIVGPQRAGGADRKSTRLNSSHVKISYAVFC